jgi:acyl carrier protein
MQKLEALIERVFSIKYTEIAEDTNLRELDSWDSFNHMILITSLEREFAIELTAEEIIKIIDLRQIKALLKNKTESA